MGYWMKQRDSKFEVVDEEKALEAIKALASRESEMQGGSFPSGERWFSWVNTPEFLKAGSFAEAMRAWRWEYGDEGFGNYIKFAGEKLGLDDILFEAIAPYVRAGSFIEMEGEDGYIWRWSFDGKGVEEKEGKVVFE